MQVKVGDKIYDGEDEPVMVILSKEDKKNISNMPSSSSKYCCYPNGGDTSLIEEFMKTEI